MASLSSEMLSTSPLGFSLRLPAQKKIPQGNRVVVNLVVSREYERDRALPGHGPQSAELFGMLLDLRSIAAAKFRPSMGIVTEPFSQGRAGRDILEPLIDRGVCFLNSARPQAVNQYPDSVAGTGGLVGAFELDVIGRYALRHRTRSRDLSDTRFRQRLTFMHRDVLGLATFYFILRIILTRVVGMSLIVNILRMHFDDRAADMAGLRVPTHVIADFEPCCHHELPIAV
jgi:hypothetical protein